ncbi:Rieske 2Fe-2S domain-containing protein [Modestobacter muralis]|uniref:Rieske 2Fe-2S domain-containing protein n=1 Tax=Modestobacter muralis TaxID=1608614 RepID=A0A6P0F2I9_9ACTN|nr:Rieske 2Fe-2S domain-containing protein [Modestobacter muralis]NEK96314.1 Rieske 2Fe-2S domain-containing protein [Modestobacter muralis]NEN53214.1 Rieske 2Fe-2S domain-containing protein [Modestobacter muralis]
MASSWTASSRTASSRTGTAARPDTGWYPVARSAQVGTTPLPVGAGGRAWVVLRVRPGAEVTALPARCPHRLVPLAHATVVDGRVRCPFHGWRYDAEGRCVDIPSLGPAGTPPPRADLSGPWAVEERDGWVWLAPERTAAVRPPRSSGVVPTPEPVPPLPTPAGPVLGNLDPSLEHAWHPVALAGELHEGGYVQTRLLGRTWTVHRRGGAPAADPPVWGVAERHGVVWIAPAEPRDTQLPVPETSDPRAVRAWLPPVRSSAPAGPLTDLFLDAAHVPVVHPAADAPDDPVADVVPETGGSTSVREERSARDGTRRRTTAVHRAPFQLRVRTDELDTGAARTVLYLLQPEDDDSTRVYACLFLTPPEGAALSSDEVATEVAGVGAVLAADLELAAVLGSVGLPLLPRDELHVPADAPGVALRRTLADFAALPLRRSA